MKKTLLVIALFSGNLFASEYIIKIQGNNYSSAIQVEGSEQENAIVHPECVVGQQVVTESELRTMVDNNDNITNICTSQVTDMSGLFQLNSIFNQDISAWVVSSVTNYGIFSGNCPINIEYLPNF